MNGWFCWSFMCRAALESTQSMRVMTPMRAVVIFNGLTKCMIISSALVIGRSHNPLVQGTPPPSRPLHRESVALKPCMESPDIHTKEKLAEQRLAMIEMERRRHLREQERTWTRLF